MWLSVCRKLIRLYRSVPRSPGTSFPRQCLTSWASVCTTHVLPYLPKTDSPASPVAGAGNDDEELDTDSDEDESDDEDGEAEIDLEELENKRPTKKAKRS